MEEQKFSFSGSFQKVKEYIDTQLELLKLKTIARISRVVGALILDATKILLSLLVVFFFAMALGFFLGEVMHSNALGFLTTGVIFLLILLAVGMMRSKLEVKFMDMIISRILSQWHDDLDTDEKIKEAHFANKKKAEETRVQDFYEKDINHDEKKD